MKLNEKIYMLLLLMLPFLIPLYYIFGDYYEKKHWIERDKEQTENHMHQIMTGLIEENVKTDCLYNSYLADWLSDLKLCFSEYTPSYEYQCELLEKARELEAEDKKLSHEDFYELCGFTAKYNKTTQRYEIRDKYRPEVMMIGSKVRRGDPQQFRKHEYYIRYYNPD